MRTTTPISLKIDSEHRETLSPHRKLLAAMLGRSLVDAAQKMHGARGWFVYPDEGLITLNFLCEHLFEHPDDAKAEILKNLDCPVFAARVLSSLGGQGTRSRALKLNKQGNL